MPGVRRRRVSSVYACNTCGNQETEWVELSGKGKMKSIVSRLLSPQNPEYAQMGAFAYGEV